MHHPTYGNAADLSGVSIKESVRLDWRLIKIPSKHLLEARLILPYMAARYREGEYYGICVDRKYGCQTAQYHTQYFWQAYLPYCVPMVYTHSNGTEYESLLGIINPGTEGQGFKACVTGDYDLFAIWPSLEDWSQGKARMHTASGSGLQSHVIDVGKDKRWTEKDPNRREHFWMGNINQRIQLIAHSLNDTIVAKGYMGGNSVFHSDEAGNPALDLQKELKESFPVIAFIPKGPLATQYMPVVALENTIELKEFIIKANNHGYFTELRDD